MKILRVLRWAAGIFLAALLGLSIWVSVRAGAVTPPKYWVVFGLLAGSVAAYFVVTRLMRLEYWPSPGGALASALLAVVVAVGLGLLGTWRVLGQKPARHLRTL